MHMHNDKVGASDNGVEKQTHMYFVHYIAVVHCKVVVFCSFWIVYCLF